MNLMIGQIKLKVMQKNWIGKSFGCEIILKLKEIYQLMNINVLQLDLILYLVCLF